MHASPGSASSSPQPGSPAETAEQAVLVCGVNWIGDSIMTMPALQAFRKLHPTAHITLLVKHKVFHLWKMHSVANEILPLKEGVTGTLQTARLVHSRRFRKAYVLPHSFRSAVIPFLARIRERVGMPGHWRDGMLTDVIEPKKEKGREHQAWEYMNLMVPEWKESLERPCLTVPADVMAVAAKKLSALRTPRVALIPGAARGPSKRWPHDNFIQLGRLLAGEKKCGITVLGMSNELGLCRSVAEGIGPDTLNLAGQTTLAEWVAVLKSCDLVIANDSGGMHLAAAVGTPVVAIFGVTDPTRTGPLGDACRILQNSAVRDRDVDRDSPEAVKTLAAITPGQVLLAALELLKTDPSGS